ncbi:MAG: Na+/H+ antiporter NhaA [Ignavibacteriales bacterium]|nr:Na+/H+ antiporter NhaA [Ignavibacteriales bacterium]
MPNEEKRSNQTRNNYRTFFSKGEGTVPDRRQTKKNRRTSLSTILTQFQRFAQVESSAGILLLACTVLALLWANSPWAETYNRFWHAEISFRVGTAEMSKSLLHWINDGLMVVFFFVVGLEIKRELLVGELASPRQAALPIAAAAGGMVVPALIYTAFNYGDVGQRGWGVPMATDIAFAVGILAILGKRVPIGLKVFLVALAIVDDLGAVMVIAIFYTSELSLGYLVIAGGVVGVLALANVGGIRRPAVYGILGMVLWFATLKSGIHATIAGVMLAATIPARSRINQTEFVDEGKKVLTEFEIERQHGKTHLTSHQLSVIGSLEEKAEDVQPPMQRLEHGLHPWVSYLIMPVFALANAGVAIDTHMLSSLLDSVAVGVTLGLVFGKQIGITAFSWIAVRTGIASLPAGVSWRHVYGAGWLGGIGFTMSLFIAGLAFGASPLLNVAKVGILSASALAGVGGYMLLSKVSSAGGDEGDQNAKS